MRTGPGKTASLVIGIMCMISLLSCGGSGGGSPSGAAGTPLTVDLTGVWGTNMLAAGAADNWWERGTADFHSDGSVTVDAIDSNGITNYGPDTFTVLDDGTMTLGSDATFEGHFDSEQTVIHGIAAYGGDPTVLYTALRHADSYSQAELEGTWNVNILVSGASAPWWERGTLTVAASGAFTATTSDFYNSPGYLTLGGTLNISPDGIVTMAEYPTLEGRMDSGKTVIVWTDIWGNGTTELAVLTRQGNSFSAADLEGSWAMSTLASGLSEVIAGRGVVTVSSGGSATITFENSSGKSGSVDRVLSITPEGAITIEGFPAVQGSMDRDKTVMVFIQTVDLLLESAGEIDIFTKQ